MSGRRNGYRRRQFEDKFPCNGKWTKNKIKIKLTKMFRDRSGFATYSYVYIFIYLCTLFFL